MNLSEMVKNVNSECHPITNIDGVIKRHLNRGQKVVASKGPPGGWPFLRMYGFTITTVANQSDYALSPLVDTSKIINFRDQTTPGHIQEVPEQEFRTYDPGPTATGNAYLYRLKGFSPVQNQPTSASALSIVSSSASDTAVIINIQGLDGSNILVNETKTLTGTTPVSTTNSYSKLISISKDRISVGKVTITSNAAAVTNVVIAPKNRHVSHPIIALTNIPASVATLYYDFTMAVPDITADDDICVLPEQYHDVPELYAKARVFKHLNNPTMAQLTMSEFEQRIKDMLSDYKAPSGIWSLNDFDPDINFDGPFLPSNFPRGT